jgi:hypothetical protein
MRTTGSSLSITGQLQARGEVPAGVHTPDEAMPAARYIAGLAERGVAIREADVERRSTPDRRGEERREQPAAQLAERP